MIGQKFLSGHTIILRTPCEEDITDGNWANWYNNYETTKYNSHGIFPIGVQKEIDIVKKAMSNPATLLLAIVEKNSGRLIGNVSLQGIDLINRRCNISLTIGESAPLSAGIEAYGLLAEHAFLRLNLNRISDGTHEKLETFVKMLNVLGFQLEGRGRQHFMKDGMVGDVLYFGLLASEFLSLRAKRNGKILFSTHEELIREIKRSVVINLGN